MFTTPLAKTGAVIPAAGQGKRMGSEGNKLFLKLAGTPVLVFSLKVFQISSKISEVVVAASRQEISYIENLVQEYELDKVAAVVEGGAQRQDSVFKALQALSPSITRVVIHDGARPLLTVGELNRFLEETRGLKAAVMAVPVKDTVKKVDREGWVIDTPSRETLRAIQTPQVFERLLLEKVHKLAASRGYYGTDDASLVEWQGYPVKVVQGSYENIKITTPEDLLLAEAIINRRTGGEGHENRNRL